MSITARLILILFGLAYLISPVDIIPDLLLPFVGWIDDGLVLWCVYYLLRHGDLPWFKFKRPLQPGPARQKPAGNGSGPSGKQAGASGQQAGASNGPGPRGNNGTGKKQKNTSEKTTPASPYNILGIDETASWEEIQRAYKERIKQYHPDKLSHLGEEFSSLANEKFLEIQAAYDQLKTEHRKK